MRILVDYRPALRERSGVGEYIHQLISALVAGPGADDEVTVFSSSWKDRLPKSAIPRARHVDRHVPVRLLNRLWHRHQWPPVEWLAPGERYDVVHSPHPLLLPTRRAAQVVTIHDLDFLRHPERTEREVQRDFVRLVREHAHAADQIVVSSAFTRGEVEQRLGIPPGKVAVCRAGGPDWAPRREAPQDGYILFVGTLEPRKNIGGLLEAYRLLLADRPDAPGLVLAGRETEQARPWLEAMRKPPLAGHVRHLGYVPDSTREGLYNGARLLVLPSFDEGFGLPVVEAMTVGVPVVASERGALPEVVGDTGLLIDPDQPASLAAAMARMLDDRRLAERASSSGIRRARSLFNWTSSAVALRAAYEQAIARRRSRRAGRG